MLWNAPSYSGKHFFQVSKRKSGIAWGSGEHKAASRALSSNDAAVWDEEPKDLGSVESNLFYIFYSLCLKIELIPLDSFMMLCQSSLGIMKY